MESCTQVLASFRNIHPWSVGMVELGISFCTVCSIPGMVQESLTDSRGWENGRCCCNQLASRVTNNNKKGAKTDLIQSDYNQSNTIVTSNGWMNMIVGDVFDLDSTAKI